MDVGELKKSSIANNTDAESESRLLDCAIDDDQDVQTIEQYGLSGVDSGTPNGARVLIGDSDGPWLISVGEQDEITPVAQAGEIRIYSQSDGVKTDIFLHADGTIEINADEVIINGGSDNLVRYSKFKEWADNMQNTLNDFLTKYVPGGPTVQGAPPAGVVTPVVTLPDPAKVDTVKVP